MKVKYPRTRHHPASPGMQSDDRRADDLSAFDGADVVVTKKMDGENISLYADGFHARSLDTGYHPSRDWLVETIAKDLDTQRQKGFVIRLAWAFPSAAFKRAVVKWVREGHLQTWTHWRNAPIVPNGLIGKGAG